MGVDVALVRVRVLAEAQDQPERDILLAVARLAGQCRDDRQLRLKFLGD